MRPLSFVLLPFAFVGEAPPAARRALLAASLGWMLDAFDVMLYSMVLASLMPDLGITKAQAGLLGSLTLIASAAGGLIFGVVADRYGRTRALIASVLLYSVFTGACGLSQSLGQLALFRILLGIGMGGEWASGAALVAETWPAEHRGKAFGLMQSSWAIGYALAAIVAGIVLPRYGWRAVFFVGVLPALFTVWVRRHVEEPDLWRQKMGTVPISQNGTRKMGTVPIFSIFRPPLGRLTLALTLMNACTMFGWWGLNLWIPGYLSLPTDQGGVGLTSQTMAMFVVAMQVGMWLGYVTFGFIGDRVGRKRAYVMYVLLASALLPLYGATRDPRLLLALGPFVAFFGTGYFAGFGAITAEIYPTAVRATAQGFTYNIGRVASALAPYVVGSLAGTEGFGTAFAVAGAAFLLAAVVWIWIPETRGRVLT